MVAMAAPHNDLVPARAEGRRVMLDNPVWHALGGPHAEWCEQQGEARRYAPDVTPFAGLPDRPGRTDWDAFAALVGPGGAAVLLRTEVAPPPDFTVGFRAVCRQMVAPDELRDVPDVMTEAIRDLAQLADLVLATRPGPWLHRTHELGGFVGIYDGPDLVAAAGRRVAVPGAVEISAVCSAPHVRGRGLARAVVAAVVRAAAARDTAAFLHVLPDNTAAIASYERLGFTHRADLEVALVVAPAGA
jgi:ribosomal protein S18 acetylase RimI-like enzyme